MKILLAINVDDPKLANDRAIRWAARTGFQLGIFGTKSQYAELVNMVNDCNYHFYVHIKHDQIVTNMTSRAYAYLNEIDLLVTIPQYLWAWRKGTQFKPIETFNCREALGKARLEFGRKPNMKVKRYANGVVIERLFYET